jgi:hypothetical protein
MPKFKVTFENQTIESDTPEDAKFIAKRKLKCNVVSDEEVSDEPQDIPKFRMNFQQ